MDAVPFNSSVVAITGGTIVGVTLSGSTFIGGTLSGSTLIGVSISGSSFQTGTISGTTIAAATISGGTMVGTALSGVSINNPTILVGTISGSIISAPTISGGTQVGTTLSGVTILNSTISGSTFLAGTLSGTTLIGVTLSGATMVSSTSSGQTIIGPIISGGTAKTLTLTGTTLFSGPVVVSGNTITAPSGIIFSNETLSTYDEGTFTPAFVGTGTAGAFTYVTQIGRYTRTGNRVLFSIDVEISAIGTPPTGDLTIRTLPFAAAASSKGAVSWSFIKTIVQTATYTQWCSYIEGGETILRVVEAKSNAAIGFTDAGAALTATSRMACVGFYEV